MVHKSAGEKNQKTDPGTLWADEAGEKVWETFARGCQLLMWRQPEQNL